MALTVKHNYVSTTPDSGDTSLVQPSDWNDDHQFVGALDVANGGTGLTTVGTNGQVLQSDGTNIVWGTVTAGAGGANTQVQFNNAGALAGSASFTFTGTDLNIPFGPSNSATSTANIALALSMIA